jgi:hypothetical protein
MKPLSPDAVHRLFAAAIELELPHRREALMAGINRQFVASLRSTERPGDQTLCDINALNDAGELDDGTVPLARWLQNGLAIAGARRGAEVLEEMLRSGRLLATGKETTPLLAPRSRPFSRDSAAKGVVLRIEHWHGDRPAQFAYVQTAAGQVRKAYTDLEFRLDIAIANTGRDEAIASRLLCRTIRYHSASGGRVLIQEKAKGLFTPQQFFFCPLAAPLAEVNILGKRAVRIRGRQMDLLRAKLSRKAEPGLYDLQFCAEVHCGGRRLVLTSDIFTLFVRHGGEDAAHVWVHGKHYDDPALRLLDLPRDLWQKISSPVVWPVFRWLGPLPSEVVSGAPVHSTWLLRDEVGTVFAERDAVFPGTNVTAVLQLPGPVREPQFSLAEAVGAMNGG